MHCSWSCIEQASKKLWIGRDLASSGTPFVKLVTDGLETPLQEQSPSLVYDGLIRCCPGIGLCSSDSMSAVHQIVGYLVDKKLKRGILYTLVVA